MNRPIAGSLVSAVIGAVLWIVISLATGATALFAIGGGVAVGVIIFILGFAFRRLWASRRRPAP